MAQCNKFLIFALAIIAERAATVSQCGQQKVTHHSRILGGESSSPGRWPWHVTITHRTKNVFEVVCGGSIIDKHTILTANAADPCLPYELECRQLSCQYGIAKSYDPVNSCERCQCNDPCADYHCPPGSVCVVDVQNPGAVVGTVTDFVGVCRELQKPGCCPELANATYCSEDPVCRGNNKCCPVGCAHICISPIHRPVPPTAVQPGVPRPTELEEVPQEELDVRSQQGEIATLRCNATGLSSTSITWRRGPITLNTNQGRYMVTSTGDLLIVRLSKDDSGTYVCIAENFNGPPVQRKFELTVDDPVPRDAYIAGSLNDSQVVELEGPAVLRCLAGGYPKPIVSWWRDTYMMPIKMINNDYSLHFARVRLEDLGPYVCQAYSGVGKGIKRTVTLFGYNLATPVSPQDEQYRKYLVAAPVRPTPLSETAQTTPDVIHPPVRVKMYFPQGRDLRPNSNFTINCTVDGYPHPMVGWFKDDQKLVPSDRIHITDTNVLMVTHAIPSDSGRYKCLVRNGALEAFQEYSINVNAAYISPGCTDKPLIAGVSRPTELEKVLQEELDVKSEEGGIATLRCYASGDQPPSTTWCKGQKTLNTNQGRYMLTSTGDLQIVQLSKDDSGTYVCSAENPNGPPVQRKFQLTVDDPVPRDAYIAGSLNDSQVVELEGPAVLRCLAGGYPKPIVSWWRDTYMMPIKMINNDYSLHFARVRLEDLGPYVCQAYSGVGKGIKRTVTLFGYNLATPVSPQDEQYRKYLVAAPVRPTPLSETAQTTPDVIHPPVRVKMYFPQGRDLRPNSNFTINCTVDGYPHPMVGWFKDDQKLVPSDRIHITDTNVLMVTHAIPSDSGRYKCLVRNGALEAFQEYSINVEDVYVPPGCTDNNLLAKCDNIVAGHYCPHSYYRRFCCRSCTLAGQINQQM